MMMLGKIRCIKCNTDIEYPFRTHQTENGCMCDKCFKEENPNERVRKSDKKAK